MQGPWGIKKVASYSLKKTVLVVVSTSMHIGTFLLFYFPFLCLVVCWAPQTTLEQFAGFVSAKFSIKLGLKWKKVTKIFSLFSTTNACFQYSAVPANLYKHLNNSSESILYLSTYPVPPYLLHSIFFCTSVYACYDCISILSSVTELRIGHVSGLR